MRSFRDIPIKRKLTLVMMFISSVVLALAGVSVVMYELSTAKSTELDDLSIKAYIVGTDSRAALLANDGGAAQESLLALRADPDIVVAALFTNEGKLLAHYIRRHDEMDSTPPLPKGAGATAETGQRPAARKIVFVDKTLLPSAPRPPGQTFRGGNLEMFRQIVFHGKPLGTIYLRSGLRAYTERLTNYGMIMVGVLLASSLVALLLSAKLQEVFSDPILELARLAQDVSEHKTYSLRAKKHGEDEVGLLTDAFNQALTQIQERETALRTANQQLQVELAERKRAEQAVLERARLNALEADVALALTQSDSLPGTLKRCAEALVGRLDAAFARIWTLNEKENVLELRASAGMYTHLDGVHGRVSMGQFQIGMIAQERKPRLTNSVIGDLRVDDPEWARREGMVAFAGYPLIVEDHLVGAMALFARFPLTEASFEGIASVASTIALGIERKRAERALHESEERLQAILDNSTAVIYLKDLGGRYILFNRWFATLFHVTREQLRGKTDHDRFPKELADAFRANDLKVLEAKKPLEFEEVAPQDDGLHTYISIKFPLFDSNGSPYAVCGISTDITERKRSEMALREAEEKYHSIFENVLEGIFQTSDEGRFLTANPALAQMLGYDSPEDLMSRVTDIAHQLYVRPEQRMELRRLLENHGVVKEFQTQFYRKDGGTIWVWANVSAVYDHAGQFLYYEGVAQDVTERHQAEQGLREAEEKYRGIFENAVDGIFQTTSEGRYLSVNPAGARMLGYGSPEELMANVTNIERQLYVDPSQRAEFKRQIEKRGIVQGIEIQLYRKDGRTMWISENARAVRDGNGNLLYYEGVAEDITERKLAEEQLKQALADLTRSHEELKATQLRLIQAEKMESIGRLAAGVAHEVKNPLAVAMMGLEYLEGSLKTKDKNLHVVLNDIKEAIQRADRVIHGLLDFSAPTKLDSKLEDLNAIVGRALLLIRHEVRKHHIQLEKDLAADLPLLELDELKIEQVFVNICMNSIQAMPRGGTLRVKTFLGSSKTESPAVIAEVQDNGPGIPRDRIQKVFDPFFTTKGIGKGTGLGLTVARQIVELHEGTIQIGNQPHGGARVTIMFKIKTQRRNENG